MDCHLKCEENIFTDLWLFWLHTSLLFSFNTRSTVSTSVCFWVQRSKSYNKQIPNQLSAQNHFQTALISKDKTPEKDKNKKENRVFSQDTA